MSSSNIKITAIAAAIVLLLAAAAGVLFFGRSSGGGNYEKRLEQAALYLENCDYDNAIAIYNGIISENSECAEAYAGLSEAYYKTERFEKSMEILERGMECTDEDPAVAEKLEELFPDAQYAEAEDDSFLGALDGSEFNLDDITTAVLETEVQSDTTTVPEESETEETSETTAPTEETTTPTTTTAAAPTVVTTTAAPAPVVTAAPAPIVTTARTTVAPVTTTTVTTTTAAPKKVTMRTLTSMTLDEAYSWCSKNNLVLTVIGSESNSSRIVSQSPAPDTVIEENSEVIVVLDE